MISAADIAGQAAVYAVGRALLHFIWQGALVAAMYACFAGFARRSGANVRYAGACAALLLMLLSPFVTAGLAWRSSASPAPAPEASAEEAWGVAESARVRFVREGKPPAAGAPLVS